jgi:hypothetical protein
VKTEMEQRFPAKQMRKRKFPFLTNTEFSFLVILHGRSSRPNMWSCHIELSKQPTPTPHLHWVILTGLGNKLFDLVELLEFCCMIYVVFRFAFCLCLHRICSISVSESICFHIYFRCFCIRFCFCIKIWKQMWHYLVPSVFAPFSSLLLLDLSSQIFKIKQYGVHVRGLARNKRRDRSSTTTTRTCTSLNQYVG